MRTLMTFESAPGEPQWISVNDGVMGGRSSGASTIVGGMLEFSGELSLANNGGFASVRTAGQIFDLSDAAVVVLRARGDGRHYKLRLTTNARVRGMVVSYGAGFDTVADEWIEAYLPIASLRATVRGSSVRAPPLELAQIQDIGLMIADKREGAFKLAVDWIAVE